MSYKRIASLPVLPAGRAGTPDEVANLVKLLMTARRGFITGSDILLKTE